MNRTGFYDTLSGLALTLHFVWILWVICGALWTRGRRWLTMFHIASLVWGIVVETGPWPCPLTLAEQWSLEKGGGGRYAGGFLLHYLDRMVYPNLPYQLLTVCGIAVCVLNLAVYLGRGWGTLRAWRESSDPK